MYQFLRTILPVLALVATVSLNPMSVSAQLQGGTGGTGGNGGSGGQVSSSGLTNPLKDIDTLPQFLNAILGGIVDIGTIVLIMMLVYVGFLFVAARGNAEKIQGAKSALLWTVIGGLILLGATAIQLVITGTVESLK